MPFSSRHTFTFLSFAALLVCARGAGAAETLLVQASGDFEARPASRFDSAATAFYPVRIPARGWFRSETVASPALFGGPDGNSIFYHFSTQMDRVGPYGLGNWNTTDIESAPITVTREGLIPESGLFDARVLQAHQISFTFGDFIGGDAQTFTARGFFDPSPVADAGPNMAVEGGTEGRLLGTGSDVDLDALTYEWGYLFGPDIGLSSTTVPRPTFTAPDFGFPTTTRLQLVVRDSKSASVADTVDVIVYPAGRNIPPIVDAGPNASGDYFTTLALDGTGSRDLDGIVRFHSWTQTGGNRVHFDAADGRPSFRQYEPARTDELLTFQLVVSDGEDLSAPDETRALIRGYGMNRVPLGPRETLIFNGQGSVPEVTALEVLGGAGPATFLFAGVAIPGPGRLRTETLGTPALFGGPDGNNPGFHLTSHGSRWSGAGTTGFQQTDIEVAPVISNTFFEAPAAESRDLTIVGPQRLSYTFLDFLSGEAQSFDVNVFFRPASAPPTANAGTYPAIVSGRVVQLDGGGSTDPDGQPLVYIWGQTAGPGGTLSHPNSPAPLYKAPIVSETTEVEISLVVSDGVQSAPSTTRISILPSPGPTPTPTPGPGTILAAPREVRAFAGANSVRVRWEPIPTSGVAGYNVYRSTDPDAPLGEPINAEPIPLAEYRDANPPADVVSYYRVAGIRRGNPPTVGHASPPVPARPGRLIATMPDVRAPAGENVGLPVLLENATGIGAATGAAIEATIAFDPEILEFVAARRSALTAGFALEAEVVEAGSVRIRAIGAPAVGEGRLFDAVFRVAEGLPNGTSATFAFDDFRVFTPSGPVAVLSDDTAAFTATPQFRRGDADGDGDVDADDLRAIQAAAVGREPLAGLGAAAADLTGDGEIDSADATWVRRIADGLAIDPPAAGAGRQTSGFHEMSVDPAATTCTDGVLSVPMTLDTTGGVAGGLVVVAFDPGQMEIVGVERAAGLGAEFDIDFAVEPGAMTVSFASNGETEAASAPMLVIQAQPIGALGLELAMDVPYAKLNGDFGDDLAWAGAVAAQGADVQCGAVDPNLIVEYLVGNGLANSAFDVNADGTIDAADAVAATE